MLKRHRFWHLSIHDVDPTQAIFHLSLYHRIGLCWQQEQASAARMPRSREILNKGGESRRWKIPAGPIRRLHMPSATLTAGWLLASQPVCPLSPQPEHTPPHTNTQTDTEHTHTHTHTCNTRFTGDKPARVILAYFSARSVLQHRLHTLPLQRRGRRCRRGGWRTRGDGEEVRKEVEGWRKMEGAVKELESDDDDNQRGRTVPMSV